MPRDPRRRLRIPHRQQPRADHDRLRSAVQPSATFVVILGPDTSTPASPSLVATAPADPVRGTIGITRQAVVIEDGEGGTVFTPKEGKAYFDEELE
jgi:hypothetical protein